MTEVIITLCTVIVIAVLTALQIWFMDRRWQIREEAFAKRCELGVLSGGKNVNLDSSELLPQDHLDRMMELARTPTPGLDRMIARLAEIANDPNATDEEVTSADLPPLPG